jgi:polyhydroxybutyrate depolymerase
MRLDASMAVAARILLVALVLAGLGACGGGGSEGSSAPLPAPGSGPRTVTVDGERREYRVYDPGGRGAGERPALVVALHGTGGDGASFERLSGWDAVARAAKAIVVYPSSHGSMWRPQPDVRTDVDFLERVIDDVATVNDVDRRRIYVTGFSIGGFMTLRLACVAADRIAAVVSVAGALPQDCPRAPARPVPVLSIAALKDATVPYDGAGPQAWTGALPDAHTVVRRWVAWDGCSATPRRQDEARVLTEIWTGCRGGAEVRLATITEWGHIYPTWAAQAPMDAPTTSWAFLRRFTI